MPTPLNRTLSNSLYLHWKPFPMRILICDYFALPACKQSSTCVAHSPDSRSAIVLIKNAPYAVLASIPISFNICLLKFFLSSLYCPLALRVVSAAWEVGQGKLEFGWWPYVDISHQLFCTLKIGLGNVVWKRRNANIAAKPIKTLTENCLAVGMSWIREDFSLSVCPWTT